MQPPEGYDSHWSHLIDAGLAALLFLFCLFTDGVLAERLMRAWWPLLWLLLTIAGMAAIAWRIAGREAATVALLLALVGVPGYQQFTPGRIDHHNVQIALTMLAVAAIVWSDRLRWAPRAAGALSGAALTIGFESAPYLAACGAVFALRYVFDRDNDRALNCAPTVYGWRRVRSRASSPPSARSTGCAIPATASRSTRSPRSSAAARCWRLPAGWRMRTS